MLLIPYGDAGDLVRLTGFDPQDALGHHAIERFEFADGTAVDYATLVSWGFVVEGDNANNALKGTNVGDRLYGHGGDDVLQAGAGSDELHGGAGSDLLQGAEGDDAYVFNKGDGLDTIVDSGATDFNYIRFGTDIRPEDIGFVRRGQPVQLKVAAYAFQKYGMAHGTVDHVSADAQSEEEAREKGLQGAGQRPLRYKALVTLKASALEADGVAYPLSAGMQASAEILLGDRTVAQYLLSPVKKAWHEAGRER